jgi:DNA mismatch repair protein MSH6
LQGRKVDYASQGETFDFLKEGNVRDANKVLKDTPGYDPRTLFIPKSAENKFTPFEKQFWDIKRNRKSRAHRSSLLVLMRST